MSQLNWPATDIIKAWDSRGAPAMKTLFLGSVAALALAAMSPAGAADVRLAPVYKAPPPAAVAANGFYFWADGSWQQVNLPNVGLSFHAVGPFAPAPAFPDRGPVDSIGV